MVYVSVIVLVFWKWGCYNFVVWKSYRNNCFVFDFIKIKYLFYVFSFMVFVIMFFCLGVCCCCFFYYVFFFGFEYIIILKKNYEKFDKLLFFYFYIKLNVFFVFDVNKKLLL